MTAVLEPVCAPTAKLPAGPAAASPLLAVVGGGVPVPLVDGRTVPYANLDYAASAPALTDVADLVARALPYYASVHRGAGYASQVSTGLYESTRGTVAAFLGARKDDVVVLTRNTTDSLNLLASAVPADAPGGGRVVVLDVEHHANLLPWTARTGSPTHVLAARPTLEGTLAALEADLAAHPTALVTVTGAGNVTGETLPLERLAALAHAHGARLAVDAAQLAPHRRVDMAATGVDYLALSGHKLYAPYGAGALVGRRDWLDAAPPHLAGGGAVREVGTDEVCWAPAPQRHEGGTPNVVGAAALAQACRTLAALDEQEWVAHEQALAERLLAGLATLPGVEVLRIWPDSTDRVGVVGFTVAGHDPGRVAAYLSAEHGIGVRDGRFCAHPLLARLGRPEGGLRASFGVGSSVDDVDRLVRALRELLAAGEAWDYRLDGGRWVPSPDHRPSAADLLGLTGDLSGELTGSGDGGPAGASPCQG